MTIFARASGCCVYIYICKYLNIYPWAFTCMQYKTESKDFKIKRNIMYNIDIFQNYLLDISREEDDIIGPTK